MARIKSEDVELLRERADIVEVVSGYSALKRSGGHTFKGLCPFHSEKTPSFTVDAARNLYHCFGCGEGGDIYTFVQKVEGLEFPDAVEWLARKTGVQLHYEEMRPGEARTSGIKLRIIAANEVAAGYMHNSLMKSGEAEQARRYLSNRGFGREVAERWQLGYAPGRDVITKHLLGRGFTQEELLAADLVRKSERDGSLYDTFRARIVFPTWNLQGDVAGFGARALGDAQPKYLNTSETPVFQKPRLMYGLHKAKSAIARGNALVVEGYTDVIALHEAGISEAVATNGVALGATHFEVLKKFTQRAVLMFDADEAGRGATERGFELQNRLGLEVLVAPLPPGRDPADVVAEEGSDAVLKIIGEAQPLMEFKLDQTIAKAPLDTPEAKARAVRAVAEVLGWHPDSVARHEYAFMAARRIGVEPDAVHRELSARRMRPAGEAEKRAAGRLPGNVKVEREALQLMLTRTGEVSRWVLEMNEDEFTSGTRRELFRVARAAAESGRTEVDAATATDLSPDARQLFTELVVGHFPLDDEGFDRRADEVFVRLRVFNLERGIKQRRTTLQDVNPVEDPERHDALFTELVRLEAERRDLLKQVRGGSE